MATRQRFPESPQAVYERALARAQAQRLRVVSVGYQIVENRKRPCFYVPSVSEPGYLHCIVQLPNNLHCDCLACPARHYCKHRAVVHAYLAAQQEKQPA